MVTLFLFYTAFICITSVFIVHFRPIFNFILPFIFNLFDLISFNSRSKFDINMAASLLLNAIVCSALM